MKLATKSEIKEIKEIFLNNYKDAITELDFKNDYELLVAIILSAQCTDKRVNIITPNLFKKYPTTFELSIASLDEVKALINSCSFFNNKAKNLIKMAASIEDEYNGIIPDNESKLIKLAGVGQKTAHVFLIEYYNANLMAVDTHVFRVAHRLGLSKAKSVEETERDLVRKFKTELSTLHQAMVLYGRYICKSLKPDCDNCLLPYYCKSKKGFKP